MKHFDETPEDELLTPKIDNFFLEIDQDITDENLVLDFYLAFTHFRIPKICHSL